MDGRLRSGGPNHRPTPASIASHVTRAGMLCDRPADLAMRPEGGSIRHGRLSRQATAAVTTATEWENIEMKQAIASIAFGLGGEPRWPRRASAQATLNSVKQKGFLTCGSNTGPCRLRRAGRAGQLDRPRRRLLPRHRGGDLQRSDQGPLHPALGQGPLHGAAVGRGRRARPQLDLDDVARHPARPRLPGHQLLSTARASWSARSSASPRRRS